MKNFLLFILLTSVALVNLGAAEAQTEAEVRRRTESMSLLELKQLADSTYFRRETRLDAEPFYKELLRRGSGKLTDDEEKLMAAAYSNYATFLIFERNNPMQAYPLLKKSLELLEKYKSDSLCVISTYTNLSHIYANFNDTVKALDYLVKGFNNTLGTNRPERSGYIYAQLLYMAWDFGELPAYKRIMDVFMNTPALAKGRLYDYNRKLTQAVREYMRGEYVGAARLLEESMGSVNPEFDSGVYKAMTRLMAADAWLKAGQSSHAWELITEAEKNLSNYEEFNGREFLYKIKARYYRMTGHPEIARQMEVKSLLMRDSLYNARNMMALSDLDRNLLTTKYNTELRESQLRQDLLREKSKRQQWIIVVISVASLIIILLLVFLNSRHRKLIEARYALLLEKIESDNKTPGNTMPESDINKTAREFATLPAEYSSGEDEELRRVYALVTSVFESDESVYDSGFSIDTMSTKTGLTVKQISRSVNRFGGKNFSLVLADYRIRKACQILLDTEHKPRPTIEYVAEKVGYRSRSHFSRIFKSVTGLTTSEFVKQSKKRSSL